MGYGRLDIYWELGWTMGFLFREDIFLFLVLFSFRILPINLFLKDKFLCSSRFAFEIYCLGALVGNT